MNVLHVASFSGNVGDNANHNGLRRKLAEIANDKIHYEELEIRRFYKNYDGKDKLFFDKEFVQLANKNDLVIIGGGNFFEVWLEDSSTGCTIDIEPSIISALKTKVLFFGLGFDRNKGYSNQTLKRFLEFVENLQDKKRFMVTVRNDGSLKQFINSYGKEASKLIQRVPDGGFFVLPKHNDPLLLHRNKLNVIISLAADMLTVRFGHMNEIKGYNLLVDSFVKYIKAMVKQNHSIHFTFTPHIYSDLSMINDVVELLPDFIRRNSISVGPYLTGRGAEDIVFSIYKNADLVVGMRFHANVCSIGLGIPTIAISTYEKISDLYEEIGLPDRVINARNSSISDVLIEKTMMILNDKARIKADNSNVMERIIDDINIFLSDFRLFISELVE